MKKYYSLLLGAAAFMASGLMFSSCESDSEFDSTEVITAQDGNFVFNDQGVWTQNNTPGFLEVDDYEFSHYVAPENYVYGFTPSNQTDNSERTPYYQYPYASAAGGGVIKSNPYFVGYWDSYKEGTNPTYNDRSCRIYAEDGDSFQPQSVMVCCNTYLYYSVLNGTEFSEKFGAGDWVTLVAHGVHMDGTESEATFYLVNIESEDVASGICSSWTNFDLTSLGTCICVYFTMDSSDKGEYGMNQPTYFCLDRFTLKD